MIYLDMHAQRSKDSYERSLTVVLDQVTDFGQNLNRSCKALRTLMNFGFQFLSKRRMSPLRHILCLKL